MLLATVAGTVRGRSYLGAVRVWRSDRCHHPGRRPVAARLIAALIVTGAYLAIAGVLALIARSRLEKAGGPVPEQTVETLKEEVEWVKQQGKASKTSN